MSASAPIPSASRIDDGELAEIAASAAALVAGRIAQDRGLPVPLEAVAALPTWADLPPLPELDAVVDVWNAPLRAEERLNVLGKPEPDPLRALLGADAAIEGVCVRERSADVASVHVVLKEIHVIAHFDRVIRSPTTGRWLFGHARFRPYAEGPMPCDTLRAPPQLHTERETIESLRGESATEEKKPVDSAALAQAALHVNAVIFNGDIDALAALVAPSQRPTRHRAWNDVQSATLGAIAASRKIGRLVPTVVVIAPESSTAYVFGERYGGSGALSVSFRRDGTVRSILARETEETLAQLAERQYRGDARSAFSVDEHLRLSEKASVSAAVASWEPMIATLVTNGLLRLPCQDARAGAMHRLLEIFDRARERQRNGAPFASLTELGYPEPLVAGAYTFSLEGAGVDAVIVATANGTNGTVAGHSMRISRHVPWPEPLAGACPE